MVQGVIVLVALVAITWTLEILDWIVPGRWMDSFGIHPRSLSGLFGILLAPFLHGSFAHLSANTIPFLTLGFLVMLRGMGTFIGVSLLVMVLGGLGVWLLAPGNTVHIGASGLIFGYIGYLLARGYFERSFGSLAIALLVAVLYGGALWGVLPSDPRISWQGHLFGFLAGVSTAGVLRPQHTAAL
ncbi:MAG: rhomboid family intramembrane serine protease [Chloroflexi bacterium]|nr:rhomboid family intramembrane serine protease [Chloroflexota bacterium]